MEQIKTDSKLPKMVMCGDHPSVTKTELNLKDTNAEAKDSRDRKIPVSYRLSPSSSRIERSVDLERVRSRPSSEHALRTMRARGRSADNICRPENIANRELLQAALVSFRWPPYLVASWLILLAVAHALHAMAAGLAAAIPPLRALCGWARAQAERAWGGQAGRARGALLAAGAALLHALLGALLAAHALLRWAVEPLPGDADDAGASGLLTRVTDYGDDFDIRGKTDK